jgi:putative hemolysin
LLAEFVCVAALVVAHGVLAGAEMALVGLKRSRLRALVERGDAGAIAVHGLREAPERFLSTVRVGAGVAASSAGVVAGAFLAPEVAARCATLPWLRACPRAASVAFVAAFVAYVLVTFGELIPQSLALGSPERYALTAGRPLSILATLLRPLAWLATSTSNVALLPFGKRANFVDARLSEQEIHQLMHEAVKAGTVDALAGSIASRSIDFGKLTAADVMVPRNDVVAIPVKATTAELQQVLLETGHSRLPVHDKNIDEILGYISAKDVLALTCEQQLFVVQDLIRPAYFVSESTRAVDLLKQLQEHCIHLAFVSDVQGGLAGLVTMEDLLEEIVGDIFSEHDAKVSVPIQKSVDGSLVVEGTVPVRDVNRELDIDLPEGAEWSTVAGLCIALAGHIPQAGEQIEVRGGTLIEVLDASHRRVRSVRVRHPSSRPPPG